ncbi:maleylpyruvate isomerase family mycothiol-dependent enzyme [Nocardioides sp. SR21]|uniref:maleylpyruvate isomerase family mycothiol-dependent enzyme n=1 Tax=Nocardioides sp. SR21 TaxID=2919501 RepID=UPI001FAA6B94|nr:maleylpyruvate isomerase family mycothiol-dependent enzyme [Nocardioides sp. SR21]
MDVETQWKYTEAERRSLGALLAGLSAEEWETPSLCSEWRVRDVAAHVAMTPAGAPSTWQIASGLVRARGDLWGFGRDVAIAWGADRSTDDIVEVLDRQAGSRRKPIVTNAENMLLDVLVHTQDIAVPLGIDHPVPTDAGVTAFHRIWSMGWPFHARKKLAGLRLEATDADLAVGEGAVVRGPLSALLLLATGRTAARDRLEGLPGA